MKFKIDKKSLKIKLNINPKTKDTIFEIKNSVDKTTAYLIF